MNRPPPLYRPDPQFLTLGGETGAPFYDVVEAAEFPRHILRYRNRRWAEKIGLGDLSEAEWILHFGKFRPLTDNPEKPLAQKAKAATANRTAARSKTSSGPMGAPVVARLLDRQDALDQRRVIGQDVRGR